MKIRLSLLLLFFLAACHVTAGDFNENRNKMHDSGRNEAYCDTHPDKCHNNIPW